MAAPRLLDRKVINAEVAMQKTRAIKEGLALAKKVDTLRETLQEESGKLEIFRTESIKKIQQEVDAKIAERDILTRDIARRRTERFALEAPIDLKEEWAKVREASTANETWRDRLINEQVSLLGKEGDNKAFSEVLDKRDEKTKEMEKLTNRTLTEAQKKFSEASNKLEKAERESADIFARANEKEQTSLLREVELNLWESSLSQREMTNSELNLDLASREKALKVRYETFLKAQNYLRNKKKS